MDLHQEPRLCKDYIQALQEERKKILMFQRELPLCLNLITHVIEIGKQYIGSEEETQMGETPVLEEFIPLKPTSSSSGSENSWLPYSKPAEDDKKPDWLRSVQLWSQELDPKRKPVAVNVRKLGGAFRPFEKEKLVQMVDRSALTVSSTMDTIVVAEKEKDMEGQAESNRKARRCWSPELHRRFLHTLQQLGGPHAATPKQIRELMNVDGLTNDEVKSHLQKYRLHTRRPVPAVQRSRSNSPRAPDFVVILLPQECRSDEYPPKKKQSNWSPTGPLSSTGRSSQGGGRLADNGSIHPASPTSSSSSYQAVASS